MCAVRVAVSCGTKYVSSYVATKADPFRSSEDDLPTAHPSLIALRVPYSPPACCAAGSAAACTEIVPGCLGWRSFFILDLFRCPTISTASPRTDPLNVTRVEHVPHDEQKGNDAGYPLETVPQVATRAIGSAIRKPAADNYDAQNGVEQNRSKNEAPFHDRKQSPQTVDAVDVSLEGRSGF